MIRILQIQISDKHLLKKFFMETSFFVQCTYFYQQLNFIYLGMTSRKNRARDT